MTSENARRNIKVSDETFEAIRVQKQAGEYASYDEFLTALLNGASVVSEKTELTEEQENRIARKAANEVESRLP